MAETFFENNGTALLTEIPLEELIKVFIDVYCYYLPDIHLYCDFFYTLNLLAVEFSDFIAFVQSAWPLIDGIKDRLQILQREILNSKFGENEAAIFQYRLVETLAIIASHSEFVSISIQLSKIYDILLAALTFLTSEENLKSFSQAIELKEIIWKHKKDNKWIAIMRSTRNFSLIYLNEEPKTSLIYQEREFQAQENTIMIIATILIKDNTRLLEISNEKAMGLLNENFLALKLIMKLLITYPALLSYLKLCFDGNFKPIILN